MKIKLAILWTLSIVLLAFAENPDVEIPDDSGHYMIMFKRRFSIGKNNTISVAMFKTTGDTEITFEVYKGNITYATVVDTFKPDTSRLIPLMISNDASIYSARLRVYGVGAVEFNVTTLISIFKEQREYRQTPKTIFVQTDKAVYKPNELVRFRAFGLTKTLATSLTPMHISIYDKNANLLQKLINETDVTGVISKTFQLSDRPVLGTWRIKVQQGEDKYTQSFEVRDYKLPKYEVTVDANPSLPDFSMGYLYLYNDTIDIKVTAKYTFGRPVFGKLVLNVSIGRSDDFKISDVMDIAGTVDLKIPVRRLLETQSTIDIPLYNSHCSVHNIHIKAAVTETLTQKTITSDGTSVNIDKAPMRLTQSTRNNIKIGLPNYSIIEVKRVDGKPLTENNRAHPLKVVFSDDITQEYNIPVDGKVVVELMYPKKPRRNFHLKATYEGNYKGKKYTLISNSYPSEYHAVNNTNIDTVIPKKYYKVGEEIRITINSTHPLSSIIMLVMKSRSIILNKFIDANNQRNFDVDFMATEDMIPNVDILFTGVSSDDSFVADGVTIPVTVTLENSVSAEFSSPEGRAGDDVNLNIRTAPLSTVFVMAIDKSTELLEKPKYVTEEDILSIVGGAPGSVSKSNAYNPSGLINNFGLHTITNFPGIQTRGRYMIANKRLHIASSKERQFGMPVMSVRGEGGRGGISPNKPKIRRFFPETWIWNEELAGTTGEVNITRTVPDSITKWVANAFAVNPHVGIGVLKKPAEFYSFQPFFINMDYPISVIREESFHLKVSVFNYLKTDQNVTVTFLPSDEFGNAEGLVETVLVKSNAQMLVSFNLTPQQIGYLSLNVRAECSEESDEVHKYITVKPEGITKYFNKAIIMNITEEEPTLIQFDIPHNDSVSKVANSGRVEVSIIGDLMGQAIDTAASLIRMPYGCGEQNMINFAPNIYIYRYLDNSKRLAKDLQTKLTEYTKKGYKNELSYQHKDGSYSAFGGRDSSGSTWLTAFVLKCFAQAKKIMPEVYIDDDVIIKGLRWLIKKQLETGNFVESGAVIHKEMQGGSSEGKAMTAFILITLLENRDLFAENENQMFIKLSLEDSISSSALFLGKESGDSYSKAITMYAMALMKNDEMFKQLETDLESVAVVDGDFKYWKTTKVIRSWSTEDKVEVLPNIEMSSYILLSYAKRKEIEKGLPIMRWLISQRSSLGGYHSTQDTVIALEALSEFATMIYGCCDQSITLEVTDDATYSYKFPEITFDTSTILYKHSMPSDTKSIAFTGTGKGFALIQVAWQYNILKDEELKSNIQSTVENYCVNDKRFNLRICNTWMLNETSGMVLIQVQLPSGYSLDTSNYDTLPNVKRVETDESGISIYLNKLTKEVFCITLEAEKLHEVENRNVPLAVTTSLYYDSSERVVKTYENNCSAGRSA